MDTQALQDCGARASTTQSVTRLPELGAPPPNVNTTPLTAWRLPEAEDDCRSAGTTFQAFLLRCPA